VSTERKKITITVEYNHELQILETYSHGYRSLMHFIFDQIYIADFGDCRGMGRCGTCLVEITNQQIASGDFKRNEQTTLERLGKINPDTRLACQILVDERINNLECKVILPESLGF
jgi:2Fe-2S ferredoxin